jgi:hypothetical protein
MLVSLTGVCGMDAKFQISDSKFGSKFLNLNLKSGIYSSFNTSTGFIFAAFST